MSWRSTRRHGNVAKSSWIRRCRLRQWRWRKCVGVSSNSNSYVKFLMLLAMTKLCTGEVKLPYWCNVEQRVPIVHVQDWIFKVAALVGLLCHLNQWILAWWVQKHCKYSTYYYSWIGKPFAKIWRKNLQRESPILRLWYFDHFS